MPAEKRPARSTKKAAEQPATVQPVAAEPKAAPRIAKAAKAPKAATRPTTNDLAAATAAQVAREEAPTAASVGAAAPAPAVLRFRPTWQEDREGVITAGGSVVVRYEPARLGLTGAAADAAEIVGFVRFAPGGDVVRTSLRPVATDAVSAEITVPADSEHLELWFARTTAAEVTAWDSRFGANYRFPVVREQA